MFAIVSILFVAHICYAQAKIGTVIDGVAKDLSEFSYIYSLTGLADKQSKLSDGATQANESIDNVVNNLDDVTGTRLSNRSNVKSAIGTVKEGDNKDKIFRSIDYSEIMII